MAYMVGDKVTIRTFLIPEQRYSGVRFDEGMLEYGGREVTIERVDETVVEGCNCYWIVEDNTQWCWGEEMFQEPIEEFDEEVIDQYDFLHILGG